MGTFLPLAIPTIFWTTLIALFITLGVTTLLGRLLAGFFPHPLREEALFYLSPVLGLAALTVMASLVGRVLPLGNAVVVPLTIGGVAIWALVREQKASNALRHAALVGVFGSLCGASILGPLFAFGAFNAHNDAFTYLVHANWLQEHAFGQVIKPENVSPLTTQVVMYQQEGFRMGGSFFLALMQSLLNLRWSFEVYPAVMISAIASCCMAFGFPLAQRLLLMQLGTRLALLVLPAFSLGGLVFAANLGFLPQTIGLAFGAGLLFIVGPTLHLLTQSNFAHRDVIKSAAPPGLLLAAAIFTYSEIAPFLVVSIVGSGLLLLIRSHPRYLIRYTVLVFVFAALLLNTELVRAYGALRTQFGAVVGSPVDWSPLGYAAHAVGVHGGAWDGFQWTTPESMGTGFFFLGIVLTILVMAVIVAGWRAAGQAILSGELMPSALIVLIFIAGIIYFRYFVPSPFPIGMGQSWSQFKLSDWAYPFTTVFIILGAIQVRQRLGNYFEVTVAMIFALGLISATLFGVLRVTPLVQYYGETNDLNKFYQIFRQTVNTSCPPTAPIHLALNGQDHKFRQMASYYLADRVVTSDWMDDGYIYARLPIERQTQSLNPRDCVIEPSGADGWLTSGTTIGPFRIGVFDAQGRVRVIGVSGAYDRESDGENWWHWVERKVSFQLQPLFIPKDVVSTKLRFEFGTRGSQTLIVHARTADGSNKTFSLDSQGDALSTFEEIIDLPPSEITEIIIETDGQASRLGLRDARIAAMIIRNVAVSLVEP